MYEIPLISEHTILVAGPGSILRSGRCFINGETCRYVAVRGGAPDWAVYVGTIDQSDAEIAANGLKVFPRDPAFPVVADAGAVERYRR